MQPEQKFEIYIAIIIECDSNIRTFQLTLTAQ